MQLDIDRVMYLVLCLGILLLFLTIHCRLARRTYHSLRLARQMWKDQSKVMKLLNIPNFIEEDKILKKYVNSLTQQLKLLNYILMLCKGFLEALKSSGYLTWSSHINHLPLFPLQCPWSPTYPRWTCRVKWLYHWPQTISIRLTVTWKIHPNKRYALIGQNRAGKSTINHLLCKLYSPDEGEITLDGVPYQSHPLHGAIVIFFSRNIRYSEISRTSLRSFITYVSQRPFIFPGSLRDNILVGNPDATDEDGMLCT